MPAGEPVLGSSRGDRQLLGNDLKTRNASNRHARDCQPTPGQAAPGDRRSGTRSARASATNAGLAATYVPTHEGPITWDICREPRHPPSSIGKAAVNQRLCLFVDLSQGGQNRIGHQDWASFALPDFLRAFALSTPQVAGSSPGAPASWMWLRPGGRVGSGG